MPKKKSLKSISCDCGIRYVTSFFVFFAINSLVIHLANLYFPMKVVLGTFCIPREWAIIHSMSTLALINLFIMAIAKSCEAKKKKMMTGNQWMLLYLLVNFVGVWIVARFSEQLGMGIKSWFVALVLAIVLNTAQGIGAMISGKFSRCNR